MARRTDFALRSALTMRPATAMRTREASRFAFWHRDVEQVGGREYECGLKRFGGERRLIPIFDYYVRHFMLLWLRGALAEQADAQLWAIKSHV
jgi:hypothetical protein